MAQVNVARGHKMAIDVVRVSLGNEQPLTKSGCDGADTLQLIGVSPVDDEPNQVLGVYCYTVIYIYYFTIVFW